jgi:peptidoglycan hydrolase-like protein with peptidoglycan-binding domain
MIPGTATVTQPVQADPATVAAATAKILNSAKSQLGVPYVYGGESPGVGFDCSGLTQWCCAQAGIAIPRGSADQFNLSPVKVVGPVKPGDLVFFYGGESVPPRPGHVGIITGPDQMINAPYTGVDVRYDFYSPQQSVGPMDYYGATRPALLAPGGPPLPPLGTLVNVQLYELREGSTGDAVKALQALLNEFHASGLFVDGNFGPTTTTAVLSYKAAHGFPNDDIVGTHTWGQLLGRPQ